ncbi:MAG: helix-turn-helix domain-containing protein [Phaeodactylibacter sp.]|nr:helix-turn-helix domain-containing protein [Phaeodactylibacter sp.]MCI5090276.1 helix-turn-helix domain-containing protein [Phaeodactylibacter sp.]
MSQHALASVIGVAQSNIPAWESGKNNPSLELIIDLANLFKVSVDALLKNDLSELPPYSLDRSSDFLINKVEDCRPNYVDLSPNLVDLIDNHCPYVSAQHLQRYAAGMLKDPLPHASIPGLRPGSQGFQVIGDAMQPHLKPGQYIWCTKKAQAAEVRPGSIYFITYSPSMFSTCYGKAEADGITLYYSNYQEYPPQHLAASSVQEVWECYAILSYL